MLQLINLPENAPPFLPTKPTHLLFIWKISLPIFCVENFLAQIFLCKLFLAFIHLYKHVRMCVDGGLTFRKRGRNKKKEIFGTTLDLQFI